MFNLPPKQRTITISQSGVPPSSFVHHDLLSLCLVNTFSPVPSSCQLRMWDWLQQYCPWLLCGLAMVYGKVGKIRRLAYQKGWLTVRQLPKPVISVGNVTVGGTGKTPFVIWLAHQLHAKGKRVAILSRGYGRRETSKNLFVSDGRGQVKGWQVSGDEPVMIAQRCPGALVAVGADRFRLGQWVLEHDNCDCFLLDDGFQHVSLHRDLNVLLCDASDVDGLESVLPAGRLRESLDAVKAAGVIVVTRAESPSSVEAVQARLEGAVGKSLTPLLVKTVPSHIQHVGTGEVRPVSFLRGMALLLVSGIGNPSAFRNLVIGCGANISEELVFPDHCSYGSVEAGVIQKKIQESAGNIVVTTEKDAVKLREWFKKEEPIWFVSIDVEFIAGRERIFELLEGIGLS